MVAAAIDRLFTVSIAKHLSMSNYRNQASVPGFFLRSFHEKCAHGMISKLPFCLQLGYRQEIETKKCKQIFFSGKSSEKNMVVLLLRRSRGYGKML
jgi:hypothetical protein